MSELSLFAFGSMSESMVHYGKIEKFVAKSVPARVRGIMYRLEVGFPVFVESDEASFCNGELLYLNADEKLFLFLDEFHGVNRFFPEKGLHFRKRVECELEGNSSTWSHVYFYNPKRLTKNAEVIAGGDWRGDMEKFPSMIAGLSEGQKEYIRKLGSSSGRQIVPIKLPLYRELMGLELIVDKGRRLALSKLGREVYQYLE